MSQDESALVDLAREGLAQTKLARIEEQILHETRRIDFYTTEYNVELLAAKLNSQEMYVPDYQRRFTWTLAARSRFIESLLIRLPIPFLFFWEAPNGTLEIVDGSQRLRTITSFLANELQLTKLSRLTECTALWFSDLPVSSQRRLKNTSIRGIILNENADITARRDLFDRINTSALEANPAEIRRGANAGPFIDLVGSLSEDPVFQKVAPMTPSDKSRRLDEELISRFFAYSGELEEYRDNVKVFIREFTDQQNLDLEEDSRREEFLRNKFLTTIEFVHRNFPYGVRKSPSGKKTYSARFESIVVGSYLAIQAEPDLLARSVGVLDWLQSNSFENVVSSDGANVRSKLLARINFVRDRLLSK